MLAALFGTYYVLFTLNPLQEDSKRILVSLLANASSLAMFSAPLIGMFHVIRLKDASSIPIWQSVAGLITSSSWALYGIFVENYFIIIPSIIASLLNLAQIVLYIIYGSKSKISFSKFFKFRYSFMHQLPQEESASEGPSFEIGDYSPEAETNSTSQTNLISK